MKIFFRYVLERWKTLNETGEKEKLSVAEKVSLLVDRDVNGWKEKLRKISEIVALLLKFRLEILNYVKNSANISKKKIHP